MEAKLNDLEKCDLWDDMPQDKQDALCIYNVLKDNARKSGNTFMDFRLLHSNQKLKGKLKFKQFQNGIDYLHETDVIVLETPSGGGKERIYLQKLWEAEKKIAEDLVMLIMDQKANPYPVEADVNR